MNPLDDLPTVDNFLGIDLRTGAVIIAAISIVHPLSYGCSFFMPISYLLVTIWILVAFYFAASVVLICGILKENDLLCSIWLWYTLVFVGVMLIMMILLAVVFTSRLQKVRVIMVLLAMLWYILTIYFVFVVNSHRKQMGKTKTPPKL